MIYLFSLLALILLLPILYFIPIGLSMQGKLLIAGVSFGLTLLGIVASSLYPMWAIGIMIMILLVFATHLIDQRFSGLQAAATGNESDVYEEHKYGLQEPHEFKADIHNVETSERSPEVQENIGAALVQEDENVIELIKSDVYEEEHLNTSEDPLAPMNHSESVQVPDEPIIELQVSDAASKSTQGQEDESEWFIENAIEMIEAPEGAEEKNELFEDELNDLEIMINAPDEIAEVETIETGVSIGKSAQSIEDGNEPASDAEEEEFVSAGDYVKLEDTINKEDELLENLSAEVDVELPKRTRIMREVMKTMIDQITLSRGLLTSDQLENMIKHYLNPSLHDQDYYTFARILMDHYILTEQYEELVMFLKGIEVRFKEYPYITMDIEQTKEFAWENTQT
jgi:hypothetical protein